VAGELFTKTIVPVTIYEIIHLDGRVKSQHRVLKKGGAQMDLGEVIHPI
jgi:hypothetical protein